MTHDIAGLKQSISELHKAMSTLQDAKHAELLQPIIHRPGWTSIAEFELVQAHVAGLHHQVSGLHKGLDALVSVAEKIGKPLEAHQTGVEPMSKPKSPQPPPAPQPPGPPSPPFTKT